MPGREGEGCYFRFIPGKQPEPERRREAELMYEMGVSEVVMQRHTGYMYADVLRPRTEREHSIIRLNELTAIC